MQYYAEKDLLEIDNEIQNLKKGKMIVSKYAAAFTEKIKIVPNLVPTKLSKVKKFDIGLPTDNGPTVKLAATLKAVIWAVKNMETQIKEKGLEKVKTREKRKF